MVAHSVLNILTASDNDTAQMTTTSASLAIAIDASAISAVYVPLHGCRHNRNKQKINGVLMLTTSN